VAAVAVVVAVAVVAAAATVGRHLSGQDAGTLTVNATC